MISAAGLLLASCLLAATPPRDVSASFWFFLNDVPVGTVELSLQGGTYRYASTHFFGGSPKAPKRSHFEGQLDEKNAIDDRVPSSLFILLRSREEHCEEVFDELTLAKGTACVNDRAEDLDVGVALGTPYRARYQDGLLQELKIGDGVFRRSEGTPPPPPDIFAAGLPVSGADGPLGFSSELSKKGRYFPMIPTLLTKGRVEEAVRAARATLGSEESGACVRLADDVVRRVGRSNAEIVYGVVMDGPRAYPHAWVRVLSPERREWLFDPAMDLPVTPQTHLEIPNEAVGETYLALWNGTLKIIRTAVVDLPAPAPPSLDPYDVVRME
ncbi:MAG: hypothetical protein M3Y59_14400 [Myxococcota bacterium]|nr:hypothetical protein [Myxococcota bacterium]